MTHNETEVKLSCCGQSGPVCLWFKVKSLKKPQGLEAALQPAGGGVSGWRCVRVGTALRSQETLHKQLPVHVSEGGGGLEGGSGQQLFVLLVCFTCEGKPAWDESA